MSNDERGTGSDTDAFLLVDCSGLDKVRQYFEAAYQVCEIVDTIWQYMQNRTPLTEEYFAVNRD